jgi:hypothetical protein
VAALLCAGSIGFCLLMPNGPVPARAAQKDQPWPKSADPLFPKDKDDVVTGYAACAACHAQQLPVNAKVNVFAKRFKSHEFVLLSEGGTWLTEDPHSAATKVLEGPLGTQMTKILKYDVTKAPQCLTCHAIDKYPGAPLPKDVNVKDRFDAAQGVTCNACHGVRKAWQGEHYADQNMTIPWRIHTPAEKEEKGMRNLRDPVVKAKLCASCHVGDPDLHRVVTHDMYAAGHPPLPPFELGSFMNCQPMHWGSPAAGDPLKFFTPEEFAAYPGGADIAKKDPNWLWNLYRTHPEAKEVSIARHISAGAVASLRAEMKLIAADAAAVAAGEEGAVDFARFDCYACHHDLKYPSDRQARGYTGAPGRPPLKAWTAALPGVVIEHATTLAPFADVSKGFGSKWDAVNAAALARPFGKPKELSEAAKDLVAWCDAYLKKDQSESAPVYSETEATKLLALIGSTAVKKWAADPEAAMHMTWAYVALRNHLKNQIDDKSLADLRAVVPVQVRQPRKDEKGAPTFSNDKGDPLTVGDTLRERLDLFNKFNAKDFTRSFGNVTGPLPK